MAGYAEDNFMKKSEKNKKKKKKKREQRGAAGAMEMKQLVVQCSVPPHDASSFPALAVARRLIHTHTSSPFPHPYPHLQHLLQEGHGSLQALAMATQPAGPFSPSPPPLIINHTCPASPVTLQQQVLLRDVVPSPRKAESTSPLCHALKQSCHIKESTDLDADSMQFVPLSSPSWANEWAPSTSRGNNLQLPSAPPYPPISPDGSVLPHPGITTKHVQRAADKSSHPPILSSLLAAAEDGTTLAAELMDHFKESLYSILPQSIRCKVSDDWDSMLSSRVLEQYMDKMKTSFHSPPLWLTDPIRFRRVVMKMVRIQSPQVRHRHHSIEDLLHTIDSFERAGLINEMQKLGFAEEACILQDRTIFYGLFARLRALQDISILLGFIRSELRLPFQDTWSLACLNARYRYCLKRICLACEFPDKIKTFAWKLDKLELCANEADSCKMKEGHDMSSIDNQVMKLLDSALGLELEGLRVISYLDTAVSLLLHHIDIFEILREYGFGET